MQSSQRAVGGVSAMNNQQPMSFQSSPFNQTFMNDKQQIGQSLASGPQSMSHGHTHSMSMTNSNQSVIGGNSSQSVNPMSMSMSHGQSEFSIHSDEFPALSAVRRSNNLSAAISQPQPQSLMNQTAPISSQQRTIASSSSSQSGLSQPVNLRAQSTPSNQPPSSTAIQQPINRSIAMPKLVSSQSIPPQNSSNQSNSPPPSDQTIATNHQSTLNPSVVPNLQADSYGLTHLLSIIRATDADLSTLALGSDLTTLGLNLGSHEVLYATFAYPCSNDSPSRLDGQADYVLPFCYYMQPPALKTSHLTKFTLETLFYIFYNMPKDTLQIYAAKELYSRDWRYHKDVKLWFTKTNVKTNANADGNEAGNSAAQQSQQTEFVFFDVQSWETRSFRDTHILQPHKFLTEEELAAM